jgi:hypothetical protein
MQPFDINEFKECLDKAKKINKKIKDISDFEFYD